MPGTKKQRDQWVDAAKGTTILLVVLHHAILMLIEDGIDMREWLPFDNVLTWLRMPAFFLLSGLFAARVVVGPSVRLWRDRVIRFFYLFVLWSILYVPFYAVEAAVEGRSIRDEISVRVAQLAAALSPMWFLLVLAGFFAIARLIRAVRPAVQISLAAAVSASVFLFDVHYPFDKLWLLVFFLIGCYYSRLIRDLAVRLRVELLAGSIALKPLRWIGSHTLPLLVLHVPMLSIASQTHVINGLGSGGPPALAALATGTALLTWCVVQRVPGLFELPEMLRRGPRGAQSTAKSLSSST